MIKSFRCLETQKIFQGQFSRRFPKNIQRVAARKLEMLAAASRLDSLKVPPSNRLEKLRGTREGSYSLRINDQWRLCFVWKQGDAFCVEMIDYH